MDLRLRLALSLSLAAAFTALGCAQQEGEVCEVDSDCAAGLDCCGTPRACPGMTIPARRGLCTMPSACTATEDPICPTLDADAGDLDGGAIDAGEIDAGEDAGLDAGGEDAGADAGPMDAGFDAGTSDAGTDAGTGDAGADAGDAG